MKIRRTPFNLISVLDVKEVSRHCSSGLFRDRNHKIITFKIESVKKIQQQQKLHPQYFLYTAINPLYDSIPLSKKSNSFSILVHSRYVFRL